MMIIIDNIFIELVHISLNNFVFTKCPKKMIRSILKLMSQLECQLVAFVVKSSYNLSPILAAG